MSLARIGQASAGRALLEEELADVGSCYEVLLVLALLLVDLILALQVLGLRAQLFSGYRRGLLAASDGF